MPIQNKPCPPCPICGDSSAVRTKLVLIDAPWSPALGRGPRERYLVDLRADELKPEEIREKQFANGFYCDHCGKAFISEWALATERSVRLLATKKGSWIWLMRLVEEDFPDKHWASWKVFVLHLLRTCIDAGLDQYFRVGQSMSKIIFSTAEQHRLEGYTPPPPRVALIFDKTAGQWFITWSRSLLGQPDQQDEVNDEDVFLVLKHYLAKLWLETQGGGGESLPGPLREQGNIEQR